MASTITTHDHPFANPPRLPSPTKGRLHSRKPSRSPVRQNARDSDPLLRDLSPSSTLRAFLTKPNDMDATKSDALVQSIRSASASERALGAKAAQACLNVRSWVREIESWEWPGTFDVPEPARKKAHVSLSYGAAPSSSHRHAQVASAEDDEYWGSLPAQTVKAYERRADEISQGLDEIDVEELKEYVLNSHYRVNSRPPSRADGSFLGTYSTPTDLKKLDDFTALVTATILQALPFLSQLNRLLDIWTIRLLILQSAPKYLRDLKKARSDLDHGWTVITYSSSSSSAAAGADAATTFDRERLTETKTRIELQIGSLGRRLDRFLDDLEGRSECVPDTWIDDFELLESAYGTWLVQAERRVRENEWLGQSRSPDIVVEPQLAKNASQNGSLAVSETEDPSADGEAVRRASQDVSTKSPPLQAGKIPAIVQPALAELSDNKGPGAGSRSVSMPTNLNMRSAPATAVSDKIEEQEPQATVGAALSRSASTASTTAQGDGQGQVAKRRAAFLRDIEQNQALIKSTKTPVRPFEHASNAFTRLFEKMKDKSPERIRPQGTAGKLGDSRTAFAGRKALSPVSLASSKFNSVSRPGSFTSVAGSSKSSVDESGSGKQSETDAAAPRSTPKDATVDESTSFGYHADLKGESASFDAHGAVAEHAGSSQDLESPFRSPDKEDFPEDWPLTSPTATPAEDCESTEEVTRAPFTPANNPRDSEHELHTPKEPLHTDAFDRMFIESFPQPGHDPDYPLESRSPASASHEQRRASLPKRAYLGNVDKPTSPSSPARPKTAPAQTEAQAPKKPHSLRRVSGSVSDRSKSVNLAVPGYVDASAHDGAEGEAEGDAEVFKVKRASVASIETFSRSEVKSIDVPRSSGQSSVSSKKSPPRTPGHSRRSSLTVEPTPMRASLDNSALGLRILDEVPDISPRRSSLQGATFPDITNTTPIITRSSPIADQTPASPASPTAPLNATMRKLRGQNKSKSENTPPQFSSGPVASSAKQPSHEDSFDRHVSEVLQNLPAPIKFKARPGAETPVSRACGYSGPRPKVPTVRGTPKNSDMTIAPAETSPLKARSPADPEVKLYHLTHAGKEDPIKLFVRIVGEGDSERVMVRVGGGWADLADYLRDFANHHGSRTVSESLIEVQTVVSAPGSRKVSSNAECNRAKTPSTPARPGSSGSDNDQEWSAIKRPPFDAREGGMTPSQAATSSSTPKSTKSSSSGSRPSTSHQSRPSSRQNGTPVGGEIGLSGPPSASKRAGLPDHKAKWVEGMIERAKKASAEKSQQDKEKYFGELGKAGGTRRVVFRNSSGAGGHFGEKK